MLAKIYESPIRSRGVLSFNKLLTLLVIYGFVDFLPSRPYKVPAARLVSRAARLTRRVPFSDAGIKACNGVTRMAENGLGF